MREDTIEEFKRFLKCRLELFPKFTVTSIQNNPKNYYKQRCFNDEFTYDNWLSGKLGLNKYKTGFEMITSKGPMVFGRQVYVDDKVKILEGFTYSIYRFEKYNYQRELISC